MEKYQTFTKNQYFRLLIWRVAGALKKKKKSLLQEEVVWSRVGKED